VNSTVRDVYYVADEEYSNWDEVEKFMNTSGIKTYKVK
jgi:hypothetical protein